MGVRKEGGKKGEGVRRGEEGREGKMEKDLVEGCDFFQVLKYLFLKEKK